jgi:hypothetical protein
MLLSRIVWESKNMRFKVSQIFQGTKDTSLRAEVIEIKDDGNAAKLKLLTRDDIIFELNVPGVTIGTQEWRLVP